jgi:hypothetical protein
MPATEIDAHEHGAGRLVAPRADLVRAQAGASASAACVAWKLTARPGTTVEMACL